MKINSKDFRVREGDDVNLKKWTTIVDPVYNSKEQYQELLGVHVAQLSSQQQLLYASNRHAVLLIFQAMDAAGKDGAIRHVRSGRQIGKMWIWTGHGSQAPWRWARRWTAQRLQLGSKL
jgi:polyphosphate kinase 2 (PPK2 family)